MDEERPEERVDDLAGVGDVAHDRVREENAPDRLAHAADPAGAGDQRGVDPQLADDGSEIKSAG